MLKPELLAPAGSFEKLKTAFHFGADACYLGGKNFSLRSYADNFNPNEMKSAIEYAHAMGKKVYVTVNIFPSNRDFGELKEYMRFLEEVKADAALVADPGLIALSKEIAPNLPIHISTQSNVTNKYTAKFWQSMGAERVVLARELSLTDIREIKDYCCGLEIECFVHGAMCISYSGRCLLSSYMTDRDSNRGECVQACRWKYKMTEMSRTDPLEIEEDDKGTYILNSADMNMIGHVEDLKKAGIDSFKIEGRMKTVYYVANVVNAYRRAIDLENPTKEQIEALVNETYKCKNRGYSTGFYYGKENANVTYSKEQKSDGYNFVAVVLGEVNGGYLVEMRNRFGVGDSLEILSNGADFGKMFEVEKITDEKGNLVPDAKYVQQKLILYPKHKVQLSKDDILRKKI